MNTVMKDSLQYKRSFVEQCMKAEYPDFELVDKRYSKLMQVLSKILFFNKDFMTRFITVIGHKVYVPQLPWKKSNPYGAIEVLCHEWVHMKDASLCEYGLNCFTCFPKFFRSSPCSDSGTLGSFVSLSVLRLGLLYGVQNLSFAVTQ